MYNKYLFFAKVFCHLNYNFATNFHIIKVDQDHVQLLQEAFSLLAYADPWASPVADQLQTKGRESVCHSLNSAILGKFFICP